MSKYKALSMICRKFGFSEQINEMIYLQGFE